MSARTLSPTASLLKNSRLFSLPPALPKPISELGFASNSTSDSATLPFPTHAAIATTESGLARGDWGLKRPLPLKSTTKTSTPTVQIDNIDSIDHITDFRSAASYSRTLQKWQETGMSISKYPPKRNGPSTSAFESKGDHTCKVQNPSSQRRWKFEGPWLGSLTEEEYLSYIHYKVKNRRSEFRRFLQHAIAKERHVRMVADLRQRGESEAAAVALEEQYPPLDETELDSAIHELRNTPDILDQYVATFLDLPRNSQAPDEGPPSTHPSAGLSYQRSRAHTINHPLYGPQEFKIPVEARVLLPQRDTRNVNRGLAVLGVGGVAVLDSRRGFAADRGDDMNVADFNPNQDGGPRIWVHLNEAAITPEGRVKLQISRAERLALEAKGVQEEPVEKLGQSGSSQNTLPLSGIPDLSPSSRTRSTSNGYGLDLSKIPRSERAKPIENPQQNLLNILRPHSTS